MRRRRAHRGSGAPLLLLGCVFAGLASRTAEAWPADFVALATVAPAIAEEIRYAGSHNFTGAPVPGYGAARCLLARSAALALKRADAALAPHGLGLKVYDCYRPARAADAMARWAERKGPLSAVERFFLPEFGRQEVHQRGYLARHSAHSRGATVDVTIVPRGEGPSSLAALPAAGQDCRAPTANAFGTAHDCFAAKSHTAAPTVPLNVRLARALLVTTMQQAGFVNYPLEWWHFRLRHEPHPHAAFDFPIE